MTILTSVIDKKITKKDRWFIANLLLIDHLSIFKRDGSEKEFNSINYIWCKNDNKITHLGGRIYIKGTPIYIGFSAKGKWDEIEISRAMTHNGDTLDKTIKSGYCCYCICGLSEKEAHYLEAHWIDALNMPLTERGCYEHKEGTLINKKRETKPNIKTYPISEWR